MTEPLATSCYCGTCPTCSGTLARPAVADPLEFRHGAIRQRLLGRISATELEGGRPLENFTTREDDDPAIALIDAFAGSLHILAWNAARLSDDGSIRRTEDRDALVDLTRMLGYEPRPALAATTTLAFMLDDFEGSPKVAKVPKGTKVASVPRQDEKPQIFETDADLDARLEWNVLKPLLAQQEQSVGAATASITINGVSTTAKTGDLVLVYQPTTSQWLLARVVTITRLSDLQPPQTRIDLTEATMLVPSVPAQQGSAFRNRVIILGQRAAAFGATAPDITLMGNDIRISERPTGTPTTTLATEWKDLKMLPGGTTAGGSVGLDAVYPDAMQDRFVVFSADATRQMGRIKSVIELARKGFGLAAKVSQIEVEGINLTNTGFANKVRETAIYLETGRETLLVVDKVEPKPATATDRIDIQGAVSLPLGRRVVLAGEKWAASGTGPQISEVATLKSFVPKAGGNTELVFERQISGRYRSTTLVLLANCAAASHGETPASGAELIGSGNAATASPRFQLKDSPLAYVPAANPRGYAPAIEVRVGDRLYSEEPTIFGLDSADRAYTVKTVRDGKSEVQFAGRLPSGTHNVSALYRVGGGTAGNLPVDRITTALTPVVGVGRVKNPVPAEGASDAETVEDMRRAAPQSIRTLDRVVSLADFEAFARSYRGIGKALATELHAGMRSVLCLTIANTDLAPPGTDLIDNLRGVLALVAPPGRIIRIEGFDDFTAQVTVAMATDPALRRRDVEAAVRARLGAVFGRAARNFGEALHRSAVLAAVQSVEGVIAATLPIFAVPGGVESEGRLLCPAPTMSGGTFIKGGLLSIDPAIVQFVEMLP